MNSKTEQLWVDGVCVTLTWKTGVRMMRLRVMPPDGRVQATVPYHAARFEVLAFLNDRSDWMHQAVTRVQSRPALPFYAYVSGEHHYLFGQTYLLQVDESDSGCRPSVTLHQQTITLHVPPHTSSAHRKSLLSAFYKERLTIVLQVYMNDYQARLQCPSIPFRVYRRKSVWGTFHVASRSIIFNLSLALVPLDCIQYVVLHELTHQYVTAHNTAFYNRMTALMPDWRQRRKALQQFGRTIQML